MASLEQIQQDIQTLPQEALSLLDQFIQLLKKSSPTLIEEDKSPSQDIDNSEEGSVYERLKASGLIGCVSVEEDLSTTYKQVLAEGWSQKYDHH